MAMRLQTPGPVVRTPTRFHPNEQWWQRRNKMEYFTPSNTFPQDHRACVIHPNDVKHQLCNVDPKYAKLPCYWTRSFVMHGCSQFHNHFGSLKPY
jgi:hypothetical protein